MIDGNSLAYRAFFALPESIATSTGVPTNAIFGFASMLVKILTDYGPKATVVVWDAGDTGRKEVYAEYKQVRIVPLPFKSVPFTVSQFWHERFDRDQGSAWLRAVIKILFAKKSAKMC